MSPLTPGDARRPVPGGDAPGFILRPVDPVELCASSGHMPSTHRQKPEVRCLCGRKGYRRIVMGELGATG